MDIQSAKYNPDGSILAVFDGQEIVVPPASGNRHYQAIKEWEADGGVIEPYTAPPKPKRRSGEFREFMELFTDQEQMAIITAAMQVPQIKLWYDKAMGGPSFSLDNPQTPYGLGALVQAGLLTQERMDEILDADFDEIGA